MAPGPRPGEHGTGLEVIRWAEGPLNPEAAGAKPEGKAVVCRNPRGRPGGAMVTGERDIGEMKESSCR
ncbi:unnamed protein product [Lota lota]